MSLLGGLLGLFVIGYVLHNERHYSKRAKPVWDEYEAWCEGDIQ